MARTAMLFVALLAAALVGLERGPVHAGASPAAHAAAPAVGQQPFNLAPAPQALAIAPPTLWVIGLIAANFVLLCFCVVWFSWRGDRAIKRQQVAVNQTNAELKSANDQLRGEVEARQHQEAALRASEERYRAVAQSALDAIISSNAQGNIVAWNLGAQRMFGYTEAEALGQPLTLLMPERYREPHRQGMARLNANGERRVIGNVVELAGLRKEGGEFPIELSLSTWSAGDAVYYSGIIRDIAHRKRLEAQLQQAQKMEAVGRLAGGVAHDFNNLLTPIVGYARLGQTVLPSGHPALHYLDEIHKAAERAASLTRQLLTFSRQQAAQPVALNFNDLIVDMSALLRRLIGEDIDLITVPAADLWIAKADPRQLEQVLVNLAVNARDAMPGGGKLTISTANVVLDHRYSQQNPNVPPGEYVSLAVSDTGSGMSPDVREHLFEPFFTTKEPGKGTGLGLATCYGIIKQTDGHIGVYSEVGHGTTMRVYLPRSFEKVSQLTRAVPPARDMRGQETILLAEDEAAVRNLVVEALEANGYTVWSAANGVEALELSQKLADQEIDLLITDVIMPRMGGGELARRLTTLRPDMRVLYISGYPGESILHRGALDPAAILLSKPFSIEDLLNKLKEMLRQ